MMTRASSASTSGCPRGTSFDRTDQYVKDIEQDLRQLPEVQTVFTNVNVSGANFYVGLTPLEQRELSQQDIIRRARMLVRKYPGARISVTGGTDISGASTAGRGAAAAAATASSC